MSPRPRKKSIARRVQLRIESNLIEQFDALTPEQLSLIVNRGLRYPIPDKMPSNAGFIIRPPEMVSPTIAFITTTDTRLRVKFAEKRDSFRSIVKSLNMQWDSQDRRWWREITRYTGSSTDRAAELGRKLIAGGFGVHFDNPEAQALAISGDYEREQTRWILLMKSGNYGVLWGRHEDYYHHIKRIPNTSWESPYAIVPYSETPSLEDFAADYDFAFADAAAKRVKGFQASFQQYDDAYVLEVVLEQNGYQPPSNIPQLDVPDSAVDPDLLDE